MSFCLALWCHLKTVWTMYHHHVRLMHRSQIQCIVCPFDNVFPSLIKIHLLYYSNPHFCCCILAYKICKQDTSLVNFHRQCIWMQFNMTMNGNIGYQPSASYSSPSSKYISQMTANVCANLHHETLEMCR